MVVYRLEDAGDGCLGLWCYDASAGKQPLKLRLKSAPNKLIIYGDNPGEGRPAVKGIRLVALGKADPPRFGARRYMRWVFPWSILWWLERRCHSDPRPAKEWSNAGGL